MRGFCWVWAAVLSSASFVLSGCAEEPSTVWLGLPEAGESGTILLALGSPSQVPTVEAWDLTEPTGTLRIGWEDIERHRVRALVYRETMQELGLEPGAVPVAGAADPGEVLPPPTRHFVLHGDRSTGEMGWKEEQELPEEILRFEVKRPPPDCLRFRLIGFQDVPSDPVSGAVVGPETVLFTSEELKLFRARPGEVVEIPVPELGLVAGVHASDDGHQVWLGDAWGRLWTGSVDEAGELEQLRVVPEIDLVGALAWIDSGPSASGVEIFAGTAQRQFGHFDGARTSTMALPPESGKTVVRVAEGEALIPSRSMGEVLRWRDGALNVEQVGNNEVRSLCFVQGVGAVAGSMAGELFLHRDGSWVPMGEQMSTWWIVSIAEIPSGFLALLANGSILEYRKDGDFCEPQAVLATSMNTDSLIIPLGNEVLVLADLPNQEVTRVFRIGVD